MEILDKIIVCETDKGNYAVRPLNWAGYWDKDGKIKECGLNHIAVFHYKEDAEWYAKTKNAEEQGLLLRLPYPLGTEELYFADKDDWYVLDARKIQAQKMPDGKILFEIDCFEFWAEDFGKTVFLTKEEAEQALAKMKGV